MSPHDAKHTDNKAIVAMYSRFVDSYFRRNIVVRGPDTERINSENAANRIRQQAERRVLRTNVSAALPTDVGPIFGAFVTRDSVLRRPISDLVVRTHSGSGCRVSRVADGDCSRRAIDRALLEHARAIRTP